MLNPKDNQEIVLGVDPGYERLGLAIVKNHNNKQELIYSECFQTQKESSHPERLLLISKKITGIIAKFKPTKVAMEELLFSKNAKTALKVAEARGVIMLETTKLNTPICEFNPNTIKLAVTGYGKSDKKQIISMIEKLVHIKKDIKFDDEYDAIAVAITASVIVYPQK